MPALLLSLLPMLARFAPDLVGLAFGGHASVVATKVEAAVHDIFGTTDPAAVQQQVDADPTKADALKARLGADTDELKTELADVADARASELALAKLGSPVQWGTSIVSVVATIGFVAAALLVLLHGGEPSAAANQVLGAMIVGWTTVLTYWLGASKGGSDRAAQMATMLHTAIGGGAAVRRGRS